MKRLIHEKQENQDDKENLTWLKMLHFFLKNQLQEKEGRNAEESEGEGKAEAWPSMKEP